MEEKRTVTVSNEGSSHPNIITSLSLKTDFDKSEWNEGWNDGLTAKKSGQSIPRTLNVLSPYGRGFCEAYKSI